MKNVMTICWKTNLKIDISRPFDLESQFEVEFLLKQKLIVVVLRIEKCLKYEKINI